MPTLPPSLRDKSISVRGLLCTLHGLAVLAIPFSWLSPILRFVLPEPTSGVTALFCAFWGFWVTTGTWQGSPRTYGASLGFVVGLVSWGIGTMYLLTIWAFTHMRT